MDRRYHQSGFAEPSRSGNWQSNRGNGRNQNTFSYGRQCRDNQPSQQGNMYLYKPGNGPRLPCERQFGNRQSRYRGKSRPYQPNNRQSPYQKQFRNSQPNKQEHGHLNKPDNRICDPQKPPGMSPLVWASIKSGREPTGMVSGLSTTVNSSDQPMTDAKPAETSSSQSQAPKTVWISNRSKKCVPFWVIPSPTKVTYWDDPLTPGQQIIVYPTDPNCDFYKKQAAGHWPAPEGFFKYENVFKDRLPGQQNGRGDTGIDDIEMTDSNTCGLGVRSVCRDTNSSAVRSAYRYSEGSAVQSVSKKRRRNETEECCDLPDAKKRRLEM